ncbi:MAG: hypothetical protein ABIO55_05555 [Ginsengibacter sp.]
MKYLFIALIIFMVASCKPVVSPFSNFTRLPVEGTWKLLSGTLIEKGDTTVTGYTESIDFIKIINESHFAFLSHDRNKRKDSTGFYSSGAGRYTLKGSAYTEHLEYCSDRQWEGNEFEFTLSFYGDTLVQQGTEKIDSLRINRLNIERYIRMKD